MSNSANLLVDGNTLVLSGVVEVATVTSILTQGRSALERMTESSAQLDLSAVTAIDSAGLALVVDWMRVAHHRNLELNIIGASSQLLGIAKTCGLETIFERDFRAKLKEENNVTG